MRAEIEKETDNGFGVTVYDNNEVKHKIGVLFDGEIHGHLQDGYPDKPADRTPEDSELLHQARNYAKYYVSKETEHGPFGPHDTIDRLERVKQAIAELSAADFESYFSDAYKQVIGKHPDIEPPVERPPEVDPTDFILFVIDVYLDSDDHIEAVSDIHLIYYDATKTQLERRNDDPFEDRQPDARLQLTEKFIPSLQVFQKFLMYHLKCQLRDCYLEMGVDPPEEYRVLGRGDHEIAKRYRNDDIPQYDYYHDESATVPGYSLDFGYGFGVLGKAAVTSPDDEDNEFDDVDIRTLFDPTGSFGGGVMDTLMEVFGSESDSDTESSGASSHEEPQSDSK